MARTFAFINSRPQLTVVLAIVAVLLWTFACKSDPIDRYR
jgi:hypothetical protein